MVQQARRLGAHDRLRLVRRLVPLALCGHQQGAASEPKLVLPQMWQHGQPERQAAQAACACKHFCADQVGPGGRGCSRRGRASGRHHRGRGGHELI